jgi:hypothetical protein
MANKISVVIYQGHKPGGNPDQLYRRDYRISSLLSYFGLTEEKLLKTPASKFPIYSPEIGCSIIGYESPAETK